MAKAKKDPEFQGQMESFLAKLNAMVDVMSDRLDSMAAQEAALKEHEKTLASLTDRALEAINLFQASNIEERLKQLEEAEKARELLSAQLDADTRKLTLLQEKQSSLQKLFGGSSRVEL